MTETERKHPRLCSQWTERCFLFWDAHWSEEPSLGSELLSSSLPLGTCQSCPRWWLSVGTSCSSLCLRWERHIAPCTALAEQRKICVKSVASYAWVILAFGDEWDQTNQNLALTFPVWWQQMRSYVDCSGRPQLPALFEVILYLISCLSSEGHFYMA